MKYFYCRVSTKDKQENNRQLHLVEQRGFEVDRVFEEKMTGTKIKRPEWQECYGLLKEGDTLIVESLSRIARSTRDLLDIIYALEKRGVNLISLKESIDLSTPTGRMMVGMFSVIAQFERDLTAERVKEGLAATRARGTQLGAPRDETKREKIKAEITHPDWHGSVIRTSRELKVNPRTIKSVLEELEAQA